MRSHRRRFEVGYDEDMALIPIPIRRRMRDSGFTEKQTEVLDEAIESARVGLADAQSTDSQYELLRKDIQMLRSEMQAMKWWLVGTISLIILAATAAILTAIAVWG